MLKFDCKSINENLESNLRKISLRSAFFGSALLSAVMLFCGCNKKEDCIVSEMHAHKYINESSFDKFIISEKEKQRGWQRQDAFILVNDDIKELIKFENRNGLFRISNNRDKIKEIEDTNTDYIEYEYEYVRVYLVGDIVLSETATAWTRDSNNPDLTGNKYRLTGDSRRVHYKYYGYKIIRNEKGNLELVQSEMVDSIDDLPEDFIYIKEDFVSKVYYDSELLNDLSVDNSDYNFRQDENFDSELQSEYEKQLKLIP